MNMMKMLAAGAGLAALAATPAAAQYPYGYANPYGPAYGYNTYGYGNAYGYNATQVAASQCTAAVQQRLNSRRGVSSIVGAMLGVAPQARVVSITQVNPRRSNVRVTGLASSGRMAGYGPYGVGAYGALAYAHQPDIRFSCTVDYRGRVRDVDINRR